MKKRKLSLIVAVFVLCGILTLVPLVCSVAYFNTAVSARLERTARETSTFYINQIAEETSSTLGTLRGIIYYLMSDDGTRQIMRDPAQAKPDQRLAVEEGLSRAFFAGSQLDPGTVTGIYLVSDTYYLPVLRSGIYMGTVSRLMRVYQELRLRNSARDLYTVPQFPGFCYMVVDYFDLDTMEPLGKIIIELKAEGLAHGAALGSIYQRSVVALIASDGRALDGTDPAFVEAAGTLGYITVDGDRYYHARRGLESTRASIDTFVPYEEIVAESRQALAVYVFFALMVLVLNLAIGAGATYLIHKPLRQILHKLDSMAAGDLTVRMEETPYVETELMTRAFNNMADNLEELFGKVYEQGVLLRDAEFRLLESQIRPHFIFNVLELINIRCLEAGESGICRMVTNLAQLLRANIGNKHEQIITFREELRYVRYYLELQKERFGGSLSYSIDLEDPEILEYCLPKLTIQPLVENSVVHGLEPKRFGGSVTVSIWEEEAAVCARVSDDGVGFDPGQLDLTHPQGADPTDAHNRVAVVNIARRIQLLYGEEYGLDIQSRPGSGTDITVTLPIRRRNSVKGEDDHVQGHDRGQ